MGDPWATYDAWLEGPYTDADDSCECANEGCHLCDEEMAYQWKWSVDPRV